VLIVDINASAGLSLAEELGEAAAFMQCDHAVRQQCDDVIRECSRRWGRLDVLYNNAAIGWTGKFEDCDDPAVERVVSADFLGPWRMTQSALPLLQASMESTPAGVCILFTASGLGLHGGTLTSAYSAAKHGVVGLMRCLAQEFGPHGIRVNAICPGVVDTPAMRTATSAWGSPTYVLEEFRNRSPLRRNVTVDDVAAAAAFLCSDDARSIHSVALPIDGGNHGV
jgi:NAD(P)-dependent dehydrogenase (short-subunit alcohol dehydrogenase family)